MSVVDLAASGYGLPEIAAELGVDELSAGRLLADALKTALAATLSPEQARTLEVMHLDMLRRSMAPLAAQGDIDAVRMLVRIHSARVLLLNLAVHDEPAVDDDEAVTELDRIRERRAVRRAPGR